MFWRNLVIAAACVCPIAAAGCDNISTVSGYFSLPSETTGKDRVINSPIDQVALRTQATLSSLGYVANVNKQGEEVRVSSKNSYGDKFVVILTSVNTKEGDQTRARIEWDGNRDDQTGFVILAQLEKAGQK